MTEFAYNNAKNTNTSHISSKLNCGYHLCVFYKKDLNLYSKSKTMKNLSFKLQNLIYICYHKLYHAKELQKYIHNKNIKS